jgi:lipopolysaccharide/colanic/teichoic acid biosynthesis glycosyltransferase
MIHLGRFVAGLLSVLGFPFHVLICACIKLGDGGPTLYRARRLGLHGVTFEMLKYRTMDVRCKAVIRSDFKAVVHPRDPRVTALGRFLRCGLDEFAQVAKILRGEMAWVGPRPDEDWMLANYGPLTRERLALRPGITGFAQVLNSRETPIEDGYSLDIWYLRHRGFWLDLWIVAATPCFIAGWKSIGRSRLLQLRESTEFRQLVVACAEELARARGREEVWIDAGGERHR